MWHGKRKNKEADEMEEAEEEAHGKCEEKSLRKTLIASNCSRSLPWLFKLKASIKVFSQKDSWYFGKACICGSYTYRK
jgi:3-methyladenine DNA glycosylase AlkC